MSLTTRDKFNFTSVNSCALFLEGLRALNIYEEETGKHAPSLETLNSKLEQAYEKLGDCVRIYPDDKVPHFYYAIALTLRNQESYAERLQEIREALLAQGRLLNVSGILHVFEPDLDLSAKQWPNAADEAGQSLRSQYLIEKAAAQPFADLVKQDWPLLEEAAHEFRFVQKNGPEELKNTAAYNLAQVDGRRGDKDSLKAGLKVLSDIKLTVKPSGVEPSSDDQALSLQIEILRYHLQARLQIETREDKKKFDQTWQALEAMPAEISKKSTLSSAYKIDLQADYLVKSGYVLYDQALHDYFTDQPIDFLDEAAQRFSKALVVRKSWNQAQLYLAAARAIQSGVDNRMSKEADKLFESLLGTPDKKQAKNSPSEAESFLKAAREVFQALQGGGLPASATAQARQARTEEPETEGQGYER